MYDSAGLPSIPYSPIKLQELVKKSKHHNHQLIIPCQTSSKIQVLLNKLPFVELGLVQSRDDESGGKMQESSRAELTSCFGLSVPFHLQELH